MPDKGKRDDGRTAEEIAEHYKQKAVRHAARDAAHFEAKDKRAMKARAKRRHEKGKYDWTKLSDKKKAALAALRPWDT